MLSLFKRSLKKKHERDTVTDKLFNFMAMITRQDEAVENYFFKYNKLRKRLDRQGDKILISLYLSWEEFIVNDSAATGNPISKEEIRQKVKDNVNINSLSNHFKLIFLEENQQLSHLYSILLLELAQYIKENLGQNALRKIVRETSKDTVFETIALNEDTIDFSSLHEDIKINPTDYPSQSIIKFYKAFMSAFYNKIELSLGEKIIQGIFKNLYEEFREIYNADFATLLLKVTPEKVLNLDEWLSLLSKSELEQQVKEKTEQLENLNTSLEERVRERTDELKSAYENLKELDRKKTEFISVAAHQIRTPVSGIKWVINMLLDEEVGRVDNEQRSLLEKAYSANEQLLVIVNNLLDTDLMTKGQAVYQIKEIDLFKIIKKTIAVLSPQAHSREVNIVWNKGSNNNKLVIEGDEKRITSVIENLLDNAIKYANAKSEVTISTEHTGSEIKIKINNIGIGVPKESKSEIFKRFYRAPNAIRMHANGSGLGLFIAKNIAERHHGAISFSSVENKSTSFTLKLPIRQPVES